MFNLRKRYLLALAFVISLLIVIVGISAWRQPEQHCNLFVEGSITLETPFDPNNPLVSLEGIELPEATSGGCYETPAEALCAGTEGAICLPKDATAKDIDWAIRDYEYTVLGQHPDPGPWEWQLSDAQVE